MKDNILIKEDNLELLARHQLFVELNDGFYHFAVIDPQTESVKALGTTYQNLFESDLDLLNFPYHSIYISTFTKSFTFIPENHYHDHLEQTFVSLLQTDLKTEEVSSNFIQQQSIRNIYAINSKTIALLNKKFDKAKIFPQINPFFEGIIKTETNGVFINMKPESFELLLIKDAKLLSYHVFDYKNDDELIYFISLTLQQKNFDNPTQTFKISGDMAENSSSFIRLKETFPNLELNNPTVLKTASPFNDVELHPYFSLLNLYLCA